MNIPTPQCFDEDVLARIVDGRLDSDEHRSAILHLAACAHCRRELAALVALLGDANIAAEVKRSRPARMFEHPARWIGGAGLLTAAAIALLFVTPGRRVPVDQPQRDPTITASDAPVLKTPVGDVVAAGSLSWTLISGADRYRVTLFDNTGHVLFETQTADTSVVIPASVVLLPAHFYLWKVEARVGWQRWAASALVEFRVVKVNASKARGDSLRRAGVTAFSTDGSHAALLLWRRAQALLSSAGDSAGIAATAGNIGAAFAHEGELDSARVYLESARAIAERIGDVRVEANAISELAGVMEQTDDAGGARDYYARAVSLHQRIHDSRGLASDYNNLAGLAESGGDFLEARRHLEAALQINRRDGRTAVAATNLVNLAGLASMDGDFGRGAALYQEALRVWRARGQWADVADALRGLGNLELRRADYPAAQQHFLEALQIFNRVGPVADALSVRQDLAGTRAARGDLQHAMDDLKKAQVIADASSAEPDVKAGITLARADLAWQLNEQASADQLYTEAFSFYQRAHNRVGMAEAQQTRGALFLERNNPRRARELLSAALRTQLATGNRRAAGLSRIALAEVALAEADTVTSRRQLARAAAELAQLGDPVASATAVGQQAALAAASGLPAEADQLYRNAIALIGSRQVPGVTWQLHAGLGSVRRDRGAIDEAAHELRLAIADIDQMGQTLSLAERRSGFLSDKWDVFVQLASLEQQRGHVAAAFDISEGVRANEMREMLTRGRIAVPSGAAGNLAAREQDLRRRIAELNRDVEAAAAAPGNRGRDVAAESQIKREALLKAQSAYTEILLDMREAAPRHADLLSTRTASWRAVAQRLEPDEAMVEYLLSDDGSFAFVITRDTVAAVKLDIDRQEITRLIEFVRGTLTPRPPPALDGLWRAPLKQLRRDLIDPLESAGLLNHKTKITFIPHGELHYLPFAALISGGPEAHFLVQQYQIGLAPSATVWLAVSNRPARKHVTDIVAFAPSPEALPASRQEVAAVARSAGRNARTFLGAEASEARFQQYAPQSRIIHLASFGVLNKQNPLFSFVELAADRTHDGRLEAHEVFGMQLSADLVVLSACQTGLASGALSDVPAGDDWIGLARAFVSAGANHVMASLWPVQDQATSVLMRRFYQFYAADRNAAHALAAAQRTLLRSPATSNPYYWAGFEVTGGH